MDIKRLEKIERVECGGIWFDFEDGARVKLARADNRRYLESLRAKTKETNKRGKKTDEVDAERIFFAALAEAIIVDWEGFTSDGASLPYNRENAVMVLTASRMFADFVVRKSSEMDRFKEEADKDAEKN